MDIVDTEEKNFERLQTQSFVKFVNFGIIVLGIVIIVIFCLIAHNNNQCTGLVEVLDFGCDDCNPCTDDFSVDGVEGDISCINKNKKNGALCDESDICFNHSRCDPVCSAGQCTGSKTCCSGFCDTTADCPIIVSITGSNPSINCQNNSCLYVMAGTNTNDCLALIQDISLRKCLTFRYVLGFFVDGLCYYHYKCAPFVAGVTTPLSIGVLNVSVYTNIYDNMNILIESNDVNKFL